MPNILLLGASEAIRRCLSFASPNHVIYAFPTDEPAGALDDPSSSRQVTVVGGPMELPPDLDAIIDLDWSRGAALVRRSAMIHEAGNDRTLLFVNTLTTTATAVAAESGNRPVIGISFIPELLEGGTVLEAAPAMQTSAADVERGIALLGALFAPRGIELVVDRVALVSARILAMIVNEAAFALMEGVAGAADVDVAMKLGTNYPEGPLRWADRIGPDLVVAILQALHEEYQEERYRPCVLLKQYARAGRSFHDQSV